MGPKSVLAPIKNEKGITLVELLVYVGSLGGLAFIIATLGVNMNKSAVVREADLRAVEVVQDIQHKVSRQGACNQNFAGHTYTTPASFYSDPIASLVDASGNAIYSVGDEIDNYFTITNIRLDKINDTRADISITLSRNNASSNAITSITRKLKLTVEHEPADATTIKTCMVSFDQLTGDQLPLLCNGEGTILSDNGTAGDETDDICIHAGYATEQCPLGEYVQRFELVNIDDGSGNLQPYYRPVCVAVDKPKSLDCPLGEVLQGYSAEDGLQCRALTITDISSHFMGDYTDCSATEQFPIAMVGSAININCGAAVPTPAPTDTPVPTNTPTPGANCYTISDSKFVMKIPLTTSNSPIGDDEGFRILVSGTNRFGITYHFTFFYYGYEGKLIKCLWGSPGCDKTSAQQSYNFGYTENPPGDTVIYFSRGGGVVSSADPVNYPNTFTWQVVDDGLSSLALCGVHDAGGSVISTDYCAGLHDGSMLGWTGLENVRDLTVCLDDTDHPSAPIYNHADPYDYWTVP